MTDEELVVLRVRIDLLAPDDLKPDLHRLLREVWQLREVFDQVKWVLENRPETVWRLACETAP